MHGYASDNFFRGPKVYFIFGVVAITAASGLRTFISMPQLSGYFDFAALSAGVIYSGLILFYEQWGWRWLSTIKNLNGTWAGTITSRYNGTTTVPCVMRIRQTWTRMDIELETNQSVSRTTMSALYEEQPGDAGLKYEYVSEPRNLSIQTMQTHRGVCKLTISLNSKVHQLSGDYFTGRGRETYGEIMLKRVSSKNLNFDEANDMEGRH